MESKKLVDTVVAAAHVGVRPNTLEKLRVVGGGPRYFKVGKSVRYKLEDVDSWLNERCAGSTSDYECYRGPGRPRKTGVTGHV